MSNKLVLITGGNRGLGKSMALHLAAHGADVIITYRSKRQEADDVVQQLRQAGVKGAALQLDVGQHQTFPVFVDALRQLLAAEWQRDSIDHLVNNAGIGHYVLFEETTEAQFDELMAIHFKGPYFLTQRLLPHIAKGGSILNISSGLARFTMPGSGTYAAMKGAMEVLTRYQAKELGARGIRVNVLAPGAIETDFGGGRVRDNKEINSAVAAQTALGRAGLPDDIGGAVAVLLSDEAGWINGQRIEASGGMFL